MSNVVLIGGTGYVGGRFREELISRNFKYHNLSRRNFDYYDYNNLVQALNTHRPEFVINAAGFTGKPNVDQCEVKKDETIRGNVLLAQVVAQACDTCKVPLVHVSSGCIYSGHKSTNDDGTLVGFSEFDEPNFCFGSPPCSFYSGCKALSEQVLMDYDNTYICRLRIPFDNINNPRNLLTKIQTYDTLLQATNSVSNLNDFVRVCTELALNRCETGVYNVTNTGYIDTRQVVDMIKTHLNSDKQYKYFDNLIQFESTAAETPRSNCVLDNTKILSTGFDLDHAAESIEKCLANWSK